MEQETSPAAQTCFQRNDGRGKRKGQDTPLKASLGRQLGKGKLSTLSKGPRCSPSWPQKRNSHQSALSHSLSAPKEGVISCMPSGQLRLLPLAVHPLISPRAFFWGGTGTPESGCSRLVLLCSQQETWIQGSEKVQQLSKGSSGTRMSLRGWKIEG